MLFKKVESRLLVLGLSIFTCAALAAPPPTAVIVEQAASKRIADSLEALGTLRANEAVNITAKNELLGLPAHICFQHRGNPVVEGYHLSGYPQRRHNRAQQRHIKVGKPLRITRGECHRIGIC